MVEIPRLSPWTGGWSGAVCVFCGYLATPALFVGIGVFNPASAVPAVMFALFYFVFSILLTGVITFPLGMAAGAAFACHLARKRPHAPQDGPARLAPQPEHAP